MDVAWAGLVHHRPSQGQKLEDDDQCGEYVGIAKSDAVHSGSRRTGSVGVTANLLSCSASDHAESSSPRLRVKVLIVTMFDGEAAPWLKNERLGRSFTMPAVDDGSRHRHEHCGMEQLSRLCHKIDNLPELLSYNGIRLCAG